MGPGKPVREKGGRTMGYEDVVEAGQPLHPPPDGQAGAALLADFPAVLAEALE